MKKMMLFGLLAICGTQMFGNGYQDYVWALNNLVNYLNVKTSNVFDGGGQFQDLYDHALNQAKNVHSEIQLNEIASALLLAFSQQHPEMDSSPILDMQASLPKRYHLVDSFTVDSLLELIRKFQQLGNCELQPQIDIKLKMNFLTCTNKI